MLSEDDVYRQARTAVEGSSYEDRLETDIDAAGMGRATALFYLLHGGRDRVGDARRLGGVIGANTRIVDDLLDGDGCPAVEDREGFLERYIDSVEDGAVQEPEEFEDERAVYRAGTILHAAVGEGPVLDDVVTTLEAMADGVCEEDKTTIAGYREYVHAAGGLHGELCVDALQVLADYEPDEERREHAYDTAYTIQVADDIIDGDVELEDGDLDAEPDRAIGRLRRHDSAVTTALTYVPVSVLGGLIAVEKVYISVRDRFGRTVG